MDKSLILAVAGAGKTSYIVNSLQQNRRSLIITYTVNNYENLVRKIAAKFNGCVPDNITIMTYFSFLYRFCYKPYFADELKIRGIVYNIKPSHGIKRCTKDFYIYNDKYLYNNRLALLFEDYGAIESIKQRLQRYFDELIIDEVQDIAGRDFNFLMSLIHTDINMLFVGDFYQHTFNTSMDGNVNINLFEDEERYITNFKKNGMLCDTTKLNKSWRCGAAICKFVNEKLGIKIESNLTDTDTDSGKIIFVTDANEAQRIWDNKNIIKLHYKDSNKYGTFHKNWGDTKGEDHYQDVCVVISKSMMPKLTKCQITDLGPSTRNKLYVAITRAHGNVYMVEK